MTIGELEILMNKIHLGYTGMGDYEFACASKLYKAAREYRDAIVRVQKSDAENRKYKEYKEFMEEGDD